MTDCLSAPPNGPAPDLSVVLGAHEPLSGLLDAPLDLGGSRLVFDRSYQPTNRAFRAMAEFQEFDVSELALATYVQARAAGKPITLLPVALVSRFQHDQLVYDATRGRLYRSELEGRTIAVRSYSQTTGVWVRAILRRQFGVDTSKINWLVFEDAHVRGIPAPPYVRMSEGDLDEAFRSGEADAAIGVARTETTRPVIAPPGAYAQDWYEHEGFVTVNHAVAIREEVVENQPAVADSIFELLRARVSSHHAPAPSDEQWGWAKKTDLFPVGFDAFAPVLDVVADEVFRQGIVTTRLSMDQLVHPRSHEWK